MQSNPRDIVIGGSSITDATAWPTWATWINYRYQPRSFVNTGTKGLGNEAIILRAVEKAKEFADPVIIVQLTNVDKWDWYIEDKDLLQQMQNEKHTVNFFGNGGFWSTGSHWPKWKEYYRENYYSTEYFTYRTVQLIHWFQLLCKSHNWQYYIIFDSPIFSVTEQQLNSGNISVEECTSQKLLENQLVKTVAQWIDTSNIYLPGIIGYAKLNNHNWHTPTTKGHPGSYVHFEYAMNIIAPVLDKFLIPVTEFDEFKAEAKQFQKIFDTYAKI